MSLYESGDSSGDASLLKMLEGTQETVNTGSIEISQFKINNKRWVACKHKC